MTRVTLVLKTNEGGMWAVPQLSALRAAGAEVTAVIPAGDGRLRRALDAADISVVESPFDFTFGPRLATLSGLVRLRRVIRSTRPDVVFYHLYASALAARLTTLGSGIRRVHMVAGPLYLESRAIRTVERLLMRLDSMLIAGSEYTARLYRDLGMPAARVVAVPYGVDLSRFALSVAAGSRPDAASLVATGSGLRAVMVAYVYAPKSAVFPGVGIKGHDVLLEAWSTFRLDHPESRLLLVGSGFDEAGEEHRQRLLQKYQVADDPTIEWVEKVEDVRPYYEWADVSISPSLSENHGAALEASAMEVPSIVSSAGALPEAVLPGSGWVVPVGEVDVLAAALSEAAAEKETGALARRGPLAREHMRQHFDLDQCAARVVEQVLA
ncbi:glycosyltransferase [Intrasporangium flavum]|uniref:glycosyltransferase n=1 Tax=Intrasporangium flavum TaxID=1428657 RepID=UPI00096BFBD2|nr:glycosyltransferase [Intrasporangium flavum]